MIIQPPQQFFRISPEGRGHLIDDPEDPWTKCGMPVKEVGEAQHWTEPRCVACVQFVDNNDGVDPAFAEIFEYIMRVVEDPESVSSVV